MRPYINKLDTNGKRSRYEESKHHIFAREHGGTNSQENIIKLFSPVHCAYHRLFGTELIQGAIAQILMINDTALSDEFKNDINNILEEKENDYYYKNGVYLKK